MLNEDRHPWFQPLPRTPPNRPPKNQFVKRLNLFIYLFVSSAKALIENETKKKETHTHKKRFTVMH